MKKLSISLLGLLAIVFAVSSAFTTKPTVKANLYRVYGIQVDQVLAGQTSIPTIESKVASTFYDDASPLSGTGTDLDKLNAFQSNEGIACSPDANHMCVAYINDATSPNTPAILAVNTGDLQ